MAGSAVRHAACPRLIVIVKAKKVLALSDTHCWPLKTVLQGTGPADILVHCGDMLSAGTPREWIKVLKHFEDIRHRFTDIIVTPGNHDIFVQNNLNLCKMEFKQLGIHLLVDEGIEVQGLKFWGSPWVPPINGGWAFEFPDVDYAEQAKRRWSFIPEGIDVLLTHTPPADILAGPWGCPYLREQIFQRSRPRVHVFGHIHFNGGRTAWIDGVRFYNAACLDEGYDLNTSRQRIEFLLHEQGTKVAEAGESIA